MEEPDTSGSSTLDELTELRSAMTEAERERFDFLMGWQPAPTWRDWLAHHFPSITHFASRHIRIWGWFAGLSPGSKPPAQVECWSRGGGKSSSIELGCTWLAQSARRKFAMYICGTQDQADLHIQSIAALMEHVGIAHQVNRFGRATGWRRDQLRTASGFNVAGYGLDVALRGIKIDQYRPDLIIFDDIDGRDDNSRETERKVRAITETILPTGSTDCAILFVQNELISDGIMARLIDNRAEFLLDRVVPPKEPAVHNLEYERYHDGERMRFRVLGGDPTWEGQNLDVCEAQMNDWGIGAFLREAQHEVSQDAKDAVFDVPYLNSLLEFLPYPLKRIAETNALVEGTEDAPTYLPGELNLSGTLEIWEEPRQGVRYVIGADVAEGLKGGKRDDSTADVLRMDTWEQVGSYYGRPRVKQFGIDLYNLSEWYNRAIVIPENNSFGAPLVDYLEEQGVSVWSNDPDVDNADKEPDMDRTSGMRTLPRSKALVDAEIQSAITEAALGFRSIVIRSRRCVEQLMHYVYHATGGRGGEGSWHDDHVRSLGLAWYVAKDHGLRPPEPEERDEAMPYGGNLWRGRGR